MDARQAAQIVNSLANRPGYEFKAQARWPEEMLVILEVKTVDTSYPPNYPKKIETGDIRIFDTTNMHDTVDVLGAVLRFAIELELHEWREFLAVPVNGKYDMPLHPHTEIGNENWERVQRKNYGSYQA